MKRPMSYTKRAALIFCAALVLVALLGSFGSWLDSLADHSEEWAVSQSLIDAQIAAQQDHRKQKAAQDLCAATVGESVAVWSIDGELICTPRKGKK